MMADAIRDNQVDQESDYAVGQAQKVEISMLLVDSGASVAARKRDNRFPPASSRDVPA